jgi:cytoskeletal protein RodZ
VAVPSPQQSASESAGVGAALRSARTERGISLADLEARTKVRAGYLTALEEERFEHLPPYPFARGFLRSVAVELGLDPEPLIQRLAEAMRDRAPSSADGWRRLDMVIVPAVRPSRLRRIAVTWGMLIVVAGAAIAVYFVQQLHQFGMPSVVEAPLAPPTGAGRGIGPVGPAAGQVPASPGPAGASEAGPGDPGGSIGVEIEATGRSWVLVIADDQAVFEGFVLAGQRRLWRAERVLTIRVGNAGALTLLVDGRDLGVMGLPGEVVTRTFRKDGVP